MTRAWLLPVAAVVVALACGDGPRAKGSASAEDAAKPGYLGSESCRRCHYKQYGSWAKTPMARALEVLLPGKAAEARKAAGLALDADFSKDAKCLRCHVTGYGTEAGYPARVEGKAWTSAEEERAKRTPGGVSEACHGPGNLYVEYKRAHEDFKAADLRPLGAIDPVTATTCASCHVAGCPTMATSYAFDFDACKPAVHVHIAQKRAH